MIVYYLLAYLVGFVFMFIYVAVKEDETGLVTVMAFVWPLVLFFWGCEYFGKGWKMFWLAVWRLLCYLHRYSLGTFHRLLHSNVRED